MAPLIEALGDEARLVRLSSLTALRELTGMTIAGNRHRWRVWHADQLAWWEHEGQRLAASLPNVTRGELIETLASVASRRLYRKELSVQLVTLLSAAEPDEVCAVLAALGSLRELSAVPHIKALSEHPDAEIRARASATLRSLR